MINTVKHLINSQLTSEYDSHSKFYQKCFDYAWNLYSKDLKAHFGCVNAIEFSNRESEHIASGGDDRRVLIWSIDRDVLSSQKSNPISLKTQHHSNIFTLAWDNENRRIFSGGNDDQVLVHDVNTQQIIDIFLHGDAVFCISVHPEQSEIFASACENGQVSLYDLRLSNTDPIILSETVHGSAYQACCFNPTNSSLIATANIESGLQLIDLRMQNKILVKYEARNDTRNRNDTEKNVVMSVKFNQIGSQLLALRSKWAPVLYNLNEPKPILQFDHEDFLNSCTLKSCCFAGDRDQYVCSGSDDFCVYIWRLAKDNDIKNQFNSNQLHLKLKGHRSIVNQVRYHPKQHILISSGVEKIIKAWTPFKLDNSVGGLLGNKNEYAPDRKLYTNRELFELRFLPPTNSANLMLDELTYQSMEEDQAMIAFFDSLVRKEINSWSSEDLMGDDTRNRTNDDETSSSSDTSDTSLIDDASESDTNESDDDDDDDDGSSNNKSKKSNLILFLSDNENEQNSSSSSSSSNISLNLENNKKASKVRISLRDRIRNLRHRRSLNLTENSEYINVLDSLNVPHGVKRERSNSNSTSSSSLSSSSPKSNKKTPLIQKKKDDKLNETKSTQNSPNLEKNDKNIKTIKNLNKQRRMIELEEDESDKILNNLPTTSKNATGITNQQDKDYQTKFKKSRKISETNQNDEMRHYRYNQDDSNTECETNKTENDNIIKKHKKS